MRSHRIDREDRARTEVSVSSTECSSGVTSRRRGGRRRFFGRFPVMLFPVARGTRLFYHFARRKTHRFVPSWGLYAGAMSNVHHRAAWHIFPDAYTALDNHRRRRPKLAVSDVPPRFSCGHGAGSCRRFPFTLRPVACVHAGRIAAVLFGCGRSPHEGLLHRQPSDLRRLRVAVADPWGRTSGKYCG